MSITSKYVLLAQLIALSRELDRQSVPQASREYWFEGTVKVAPKDPNGGRKAQWKSEVNRSGRK